MKKTIFLLVSVLIFTMSSCNKDDESTNARFSVRQKITSTKSAQVGTFVFTKANIGIGEIEFEMEFETGVNDYEIEYEFDGPFLFDILTGTSTPAVNAVEIEPGTYHELEFEIENVLSSGKSIEISGTYDDGTAYQFEFTSTFEDDYEIENYNGINVTFGQTTNFVLELDLAKLFNGVDFSNANMGTDNIIRINSSSNSDLASIIEDNLDDIMDFDDDLDDD